MIQDFRDPSVGTDLVADLCVVGAGPAGLAIAREFLGTGMSVLVIESGGLHTSPDVDDLKVGENVGLPLSLVEGRARTFGGTGTLWPGQCIRLDETDFDARDWVPHSGWPFDRTLLDPFYGRAAAWLRIPQPQFDEQAWQRFGLAPPAFAPDRLVHRSSVYSTHPDVGDFYRGDLGASPDVRVLLHATATHVDTTGGVARELTVRSHTGRTGRVRARATVLCGGGIENARLLLLSGLGERNDAVGRHLQDHPTLWLDVATERSTRLQEFYGWLGRGKVRYVPRIRLAPQVQREHGVLNAIATLIHDRADTPGLRTARAVSSALQARRRPEGVGPTQVGELLRELPRVGVGAFRRFAQGRPSAAPLERTRVQILLEQSPNPDSRISLSSDTDGLGLRRARVDWRLSELERRTARVFLDVLDEQFRELGLGHVQGSEWLDEDEWTKGFEDAYHPIGTTRMSASSTTGVVDPDLQVHGVDGLHVCGTSVFPTSGYANPTLTIVALALRLADHLRASAPRGPSWT